MLTMIYDVYSQEKPKKSLYILKNVLLCNNTSRVEGFGEFSTRSASLPRGFHVDCPKGRA